MRNIKNIVILVFILIITSPIAFSHSIFTKDKENEVVTDKTLPFFINIYSNSEKYDVIGDFDENEVSYSPQVIFFNKKIDDTQEETKNNFFVSAKHSTSVGMNKKESDTIEFITDYSLGKWNLKSGLSQETLSGSNTYSNYFSIEPTYKLNDRISLFGGVSHSITDKYDQTKFGVKWTPVKYNRFEFKLSVSNYTKQFYNYRNKLNFETIFKI